MQLVVFFFLYIYYFSTFYFSLLFFFFVCTHVCACACIFVVGVVLFGFFYYLCLIYGVSTLEIHWDFILYRLHLSE